MMEFWSPVSAALARGFDATDTGMGYHGGGGGGGGEYDVEV